MSNSRKDHKGRVLRKGEYDRTHIDGRYRFQYSEMGGGVVYASTLEELREKEKQIQRDLLDGIYSRLSAATSLNELFERDMFVKGLRESTRFNYVSMWNKKVKNTLGVMRVCDIKNLHIRQFYAQLEKDGAKKNTIKFIHNMIRSALEIAVTNDLIRKNPAIGIKYGGETNVKKALTREEQDSLVAFLQKSETYKMYLPMVVILLGTGLRVSELCGLTWNDVDFKNNTIIVNKQLLKVRGMAKDGKTLYVEKTKTEKGTRIIPMTVVVHKAFRAQQRLMLFLGRKCFTEIDGVTDFIFVTRNHYPFSVANVNAVLKGVVNAHNKENELQLPHFCAHILRHTAATRMIESGMSPKAVQIILGHSSIQITMDTYVNPDAVHIQDEMKKAENIMNLA
ncbi:MAG: site-specific integrase [Lachnospiraceae bacterium]|nr:site-specific integrase [Lachnospiraceae bacterium]